MTNILITIQIFIDQFSITLKIELDKFWYTVGSS